MFLPIALLFLAASAPQGIVPAPERGRDPYVFRCVLDGRPRAVVMALSPELWVAYDTLSCTLIKAWRGGFADGTDAEAALGRAHPVSQGPSYIEGLEGEGWSAEVGGLDVAVVPRFQGHLLERGRMALLWAIELPDGRAVMVEERPEFVRPESLFDADRRDELGLVEGDPGLRRHLRVLGIPEDVKLRVMARIGGQRGMRLSGPSERERLVEIVDAQGRPATEIISQLVLMPQVPSNQLTLFFEPFPWNEAASAAGGAR